MKLIYTEKYKRHMIITSQRTQQFYSSHLPLCDLICVMSAHLFRTHDKRNVPILG